MKATRFMRIPFIVTGYEVTDENMDIIADWCEGHVIRRNTDRPFVRVPVNRPTNPHQTKAFAGTWVIASLQRGQNSFKVYTTAWLSRHFMEVPAGIEEDVPDEAETTSPVVETDICCHHNHIGGNVRSLPVQKNGHIPATSVRPAQ